MCDLKIFSVEKIKHKFEIGFSWIFKDIYTGYGEIIAGV